jgi:hypothetical protein
MMMMMMMIMGVMCVLFGCQLINKTLNECGGGGSLLSYRKTKI